MMSTDNAFRLGKLIVIGMGIQLVVIAYVFYQSYQGRSDVVDAQRNGCERSKLDRASNAKGWRTAQARSKSQGQPQFAELYQNIAQGLEQRSRINCVVEFPKAGFLP
jgi:hypothetical protein